MISPFSFFAIKVVGGVFSNVNSTSSAHVPSGKLLFDNNVFSNAVIYTNCTCAVYY